LWERRINPSAAADPITTVMRIPSGPTQEFPMTLVRRVRALLRAVVGAAGLAAAGCATGEVVRVPPVHDLPRELDKVSLPAYRIEPPDVLLIEAVKAVPKPPYKVEPL